MGKRALILAVIVLTALLITAPTAQAGLLAPSGACPQAEAHAVPSSAKRHALRCLIRYARAHAGRHSVAGSRRLHEASVDKSRAILACGLSHYACGHPLGYWAHAEGWCNSGTWRFGENLATGYRTARGVMAAWLASPEHRANILGAFRTVGTSYRRRTHLWVLQFGRCT